MRRFLIQMEDSLRGWGWHTANFFSISAYLILSVSGKEFRKRFVGDDWYWWKSHIENSNNTFNFFEEVNREPTDADRADLAQW